jgi:hypothetical protein
MPRPHRVAARPNDYGKSPQPSARSVLAHVATVEPLLRATCTHELDASQPLADVVDALVAIGTAVTADGRTRGRS